MYRLGWRELNHVREEIYRESSCPEDRASRDSRDLTVGGLAAEDSAAEEDKLNSSVAVQGAELEPPESFMGLGKIFISEAAGLEVWENKFGPTRSGFCGCE